MMRHSGNGKLFEAARAGDVAAHIAAVQAAESAALELGEEAETQVAGAVALARPLQAPDPDDGVLGVFSIARPAPAFSERQRELFGYLTNQAVLSIENVGLHETIQRQAITDELTGLFNHRHFQEVMANEVERARRFDQELGLVMFDIDDFKQVNDTYGHLQGDRVLEEVAPRPARVLARGRRARALRRGGDGRGAAADGPARGLRVRRARAPPDRDARSPARRRATASCA